MKDLARRLPPMATLGPLLALLAACAFFSYKTDTFLSGQNFSLVMQQVMVVGLLAVGQTLIILTAGIDLSCGMVMALGSIVMTKFAVELGLHPVLAIMVGVAATTLFGWVNGLLVTRIKLPPFIVTLGTMNIAFAITQIYSGSQTVTDLPEAMTYLGDPVLILGTPVARGVLVLMGLYAAVWFALTQTAPGRHLYAVGNNREAARLTGISTERVLLSIYALAGMFYGLAAMLSVARTGVGDPQAGQTENLDSITAVVMGGTSLFGGRGTIVGTLIGALIVGVFGGLAYAGAPAANRQGVDPSEEITKVLKAWASAWSGKDVKTYLSFYARDFKPPSGESRAEWAKSRTARIQAPRHIAVSVDSPRVSFLSDDLANVSFRQSYRSDRTNLVSTKTLVMARSGGKWLIRQERAGN